MTTEQPTTETEPVSKLDTGSEPADDRAGAANAAPDDVSNLDTPDDPATFPREYVQNLRDENARYRQRARTADDLSTRLHLELVRATGRLADPSDLPYDEGHLEDVDILDAAIDDLLARKPHLASRRPTGDIGQGATGEAASVDLAGILRSRAG